MGLFPMNVGGGGTSLDLEKNQYKVKRPTSNSSGIFPYPDYSSGTITTGTPITITPYSSNTPIAFDANVESFSTMKIHSSAGSNQSECTMIGKDGKVYNGRIGISTSDVSLDISDYEYIMIGIMWSGSSTSFVLAFS